MKALEMKVIDGGNKEKDGFGFMYMPEKSVENPLVHEAVMQMRQYAKEMGWKWKETCLGDLIIKIAATEMFPEIPVLVGDYSTSQTLVYLEVLAEIVIKDDLIETPAPNGVQLTIDVPKMVAGTDPEMFAEKATRRCRFGAYRHSPLTNSVEYSVCAPISYSKRAITSAFDAIIATTLDEYPRGRENLIF